MNYNLLAYDTSSFHWPVYFYVVTPLLSGTVTTDNKKRETTGLISKDSFEFNFQTKAVFRLKHPPKIISAGQGHASSLDDFSILSKASKE